MSKRAKCSPYCEEDCNDCGMRDGVLKDGRSMRFPFFTDGRTAEFTDDDEHKAAAKKAEEAYAKMCERKRNAYRTPAAAPTRQAAPPADRAAAEGARESAFDRMVARKKAAYKGASA